MRFKSSIKRILGKASRFTANATSGAVTGKPSKQIVSNFSKIAGEKSNKPATKSSGIINRNIYFAKKKRPYDSVFTNIK